MSGSPAPPPPGSGAPYSPYNPQQQQGPLGAPSPQFFAVLSQMLITLNAIATSLTNGIPSFGTAPTYTFATLPAAPSDGLVAYVSNARKPGEIAGAGTGMLAFSSLGTWYSTAGTLLTD